MGFSLITIFEIGQYIFQILLKKLKCSSGPVTTKRQHNNDSRKSKKNPWHDCCHCLGKPCQNGPTPTVEEIRCDLNEITDLNDLNVNT